MRVLVTGADGFLGRNLSVRMAEAGHFDVLPIGRGSTQDDLRRAARSADAVVHLAGVNRPTDEAEFATGNTEFTSRVCGALVESGKTHPIVFSSSTQASLDNPYGRSKREAEEVLLRHSRVTGSPVYLFRLTNVFGKWSRPNYNSVVATFCHNVARGLPVTVHDSAAPLNLVYVDDVVTAFLDVLANPGSESGVREAGPIHCTTVGALLGVIRAIHDGRQTLVTPRVGDGLVRALNATYLSFLPPESFSYAVPRHADPRGEFVEMLRTVDSGQVSYFTAHPGVKRGGHYHHSKSEKFLVIKGTARFGFRHVLSGERYELVVRGGEGIIVETVPGWAHDVTNIGADELLCMLWANEQFDRDLPDTIAMKVDG